MSKTTRLAGGFAYLPLHAHGPLLFRLLHGLFGAAAAVEEQQIPRVLVKVALA